MNGERCDRGPPTPARRSRQLAVRNVRPVTADRLSAVQPASCYLPALCKPRPCRAFGTSTPPISPSGPTSSTPGARMRRGTGSRSTTGRRSSRWSCTPRRAATRSSGSSTTFADKGEREVALRPEMTPTVARMVAARASGMKKPIRWFSIPQFFRYERQQRGRLREHFQLNCDLIGEPGPLADAEIIALAIDMMRAFGLGPAGCPGAALATGGVLIALLAGRTVKSRRSVVQLAFRRARQDRPDAAREDHLPGSRRRRLLDCGDRAGRSRSPQLREASSRSARPGADCPDASRRPASRSAAVHRRAWMRWVWREFVDVDLTIVRGLAYYTGTVFELFDAGADPPGHLPAAGATTAC